MKKLLSLCLLACLPLAAQQIPAPTELSGSPFFIKNTWIIGGTGNWDYLKMDPRAHQLFIAHGAQVQVVDVESGAVAGQISGLREAHGIALDESGEFGYISDGLAGQVKVFDRRTFKVVAAIPTGPSPRAIVFEPQSRLIFVIGGAPQARTPGAQNARVARPVATRPTTSTITVIDAQTRRVLATILMPGALGFAQTGGAGEVYVSIVDRNQIARLDGQAIAAQAIASRSQAGTPEAEADKSGSGQAPGVQSGGAKPVGAEVTLDWTGLPRSAQASDSRVRFLSLGPGCREPRSLAVDSRHLRLFVACDDMKMAVLNAVTGEPVASLPTGPGTDAIGYDAGRGLIYTANGGANGSLTIIHQDVTDTYAVIQNLPTRQRARTLAVDSATGDVYLVTDLLGMNLAQPGSIGTLQAVPVNGSFQVLVVGH